MVRWVESLAVPAKRFMRAAARDALDDHFAAAAVTVAFLGAPSAHLSVLALEGFVADLLAVVALLRPHSAFEDSSVS